MPFKLNITAILLMATFVFISPSSKADTSNCFQDGAPSECSQPENEALPAVLKLKTGVEITLIREDGRSIGLFRGTSGRLMADLSSGERFAIQMHNQTDTRLLSVVAIDGLNVATSEVVNAKQLGFILQPHSVTVIDAWRRTNAPFRASNTSQSERSLYQPVSSGVIAAAIFREKNCVEEVKSKRFKDFFNQALRDQALKDNPRQGRADFDRAENPIEMAWIFTGQRN